MIEYFPFIWVSVAVLSVVVEAATLSFVPFFFVPASVVSLFLSFVGLSEWIQVVVFFALSTALLIISKTLLRRYTGVTKSSAGDISVVGKRALVIESIDGLRGTGTVRIDGKTWRARLKDSSDIAFSGEIVSVVQIEEAVLYCE